MYIDTIPNRQSPATILLRESYREDGKVKKRTIANISHWPNARIDAIKLLLKGEFDCGIPLDERPESGHIFGVLFTLKTIADRLHISSVLGHQKIAKLALFLILARVATRGSRLYALKWAENHAIAETIGITSLKKDDLYNALDWLSDHQELIEKKMFHRRYKNESPDLFLYDVTSSYFEGIKNELADWGFNRDKKNGKMQIVIGLLTDNTGEPLAVRVFEGNTSDTSTIPEQILTVAQKFKAKRVCFVGDKGMIKGPQISQLEDAEFNYITSITKKEINTLIEKNCLQYELFSEFVAEVEDNIEVEETKENEIGEIVKTTLKKTIRYVIRRNPLCMKEIRSNRNERIIKAKNFAIEKTKYLRDGEKRDPEVAIRKIKDKISKYKLTKILSAELNGDDGREIKVNLDQNELSVAEKLDGCYVIKTDLKKDMITTQEVHDRYKDLSKVERAFKLMKTEYLEIRPIFVRLEKRTRGHVFVCELAYMILREMRRCLSARFGIDDEGRLEIDEDIALESLSRITLLLYKTDKGRVIPDIAEPDQRQKQILDSLGIYLPLFRYVSRKVK
ncbi:MAG: IS1634 family transposase [Desulfobacterales bacterium]|nr:IS1634 family transposase [Desulfobacterales bacterium]